MQTCDFVTCQESSSGKKAVWPPDCPLATIVTLTSSYHFL